MRHLIASLVLSLLLAGQAFAFGTPNWNVYKDIAYGPDPENKADLYLLKGANHPVMIFIHGGAWVGGDKSTYSDYYAKKYGDAGFSVVLLNYRLAKLNDRNTQWPAQLQDVQLAVRWIRYSAPYLGLDPNRIGVFGDSAGGHLALLLGSLKTTRPGDRSDRFAGVSPAANFVIDMFGPSDLTVPAYYAPFDGSPLFGGQKYQDAPEIYADASPVRYLTAASAPTFIIQGTTDSIVPLQSSLDLHEEMNRKGVLHWVQLFNGGHWFLGAPSSQKNTADNNALAAARMVLRP